MVEVFDCSCCLIVVALDRAILYINKVVNEQIERIRADIASATVALTNEPLIHSLELTHAR